MRSWLPITGLLLLAGVPTWWFLAPGPTPSAVVPGVPMHGAPAVESAPAAVEVERREVAPEKWSVLAELEERYRLLQESARLEEREKEDRHGPWIRGSIVVLDAHGVEYTREDGELQFCRTDESVQPQESVSVTAGRFEVDLRGGSALEIEDLVLGGRRVRLEQYALPAEEEEPILRGHWVDPVRLRVVDAETGADLPRVLLEGGGVPPQDPRPSPIPLDPPPTWEMFGLTWYRVGSPGYASTDIHVDFAAESERRVELHRGAALEVTLIGTLPGNDGRRVDRSIHVRLYRGGGRTNLLPLPSEYLERSLRLVADVWEQELQGLARHPDGIPFEGEVDEEQVRADLASYEEYLRTDLGDVIASAAARTDRPIVWQCLPPGPMLLTVEIEQGSGPILARQDVTLVAGRTSRVEFVLPDSPPAEAPEDPVLVPLAGTLDVPSAWCDSHCSHSDSAFFLIHLSPAGGLGPTVDLLATPVSPGRWRFDAGVVPVGDYDVVLLRCHPEWRTSVATGPHGDRDVRLEVTPPAEVTLRLLDLHAGTPVERLPLDSVPTIAWDWDPASRSYRARTFPGPVQIFVRSETWVMPCMLGQVLHPGQNTIVREVQRVSQIDLQFWDGREELSSGLSVMMCIDVRGLDGQGTRIPDSFNRILLSAGGRYEVTLPELPGFDPVAPFTVDVPEGGVVRHRVLLTRTP